jgi:hypothetical protein
MQPVFEKAGIEFPEEKRRKGLQSNHTFIIALVGQAIAGHLEYSRSWNDRKLSGFLLLACHDQE